jgi:hypothetical protein
VSSSKHSAESVCPHVGCEEPKFPWVSFFASARRPLLATFADADRGDGPWQWRCASGSQRHTRTL